MALPTLEDVARAANVSTATVSRCLNNPGQVLESTRERVMSAVEELRYTPNYGARALAARRTDTFGAVVPTMENSIFARGLQAFQETLVANSATLLVASSNYEAAAEEVQIRNLVARNADGILLIGAERDPAIYQLLHERGVPVVVAWATGQNDGVSFVGFDNFNASRELAHKGISLGHKNIGYISAQMVGNDRARARVDGVRAAMRESGLSVHDLKLIETSYDVSLGMQAFIDLMKMEPKPTLVMCGNDVLAAGALMGARALKLRIPEDVSITGFDDIELANIVTPALTTVHVPHRNMGRLAGEILIDATRNNGVNRNIVLDTHIVERESLAPPSK